MTRLCSCWLDAVSCPRRLLFLRLQWITCGIQLVGLSDGKWGSSCWRPVWDDVVLNFHPSGHIVLCTTASSHFTFIQYEPLFPFVVFQRPKPQWDLWFCEHSCTFQEKVLICSHAYLLYTYFTFQYHTHSKWDSIPFELHSRIWAPYLSGPEEASFFVIDKVGKIKNYWS